MDFKKFENCCEGNIEYHSETQSCDDQDFFLAEFYVCSECGQHYNPEDFPT